MHSAFGQHSLSCSQSSTLEPGHDMKTFLLTHRHTQRETARSNRPRHICDRRRGRRDQDRIGRALGVRRMGHRPVHACRRALSPSRPTAATSAAPSIPRTRRRRDAAQPTPGHWCRTDARPSSSAPPAVGRPPRRLGISRRGRCPTAWPGRTVHRASCAHREAPMVAGRQRPPPSAIKPAQAGASVLQPPILVTRRR